MPVAQKTNLVGQVFSSVAPSYDIMNDLMSGGLHRLWKDRLVDRLHVFPGMRHVDVAGGTGDVGFRILDKQRSRGLKPHYNNGNDEDDKGGSMVTVCDINPSMLREGKNKARARDIAFHEIDWIEGNAEALPFDDSSFDSYTIAFGIRNVTDRSAALKEAFRVLKPGGCFLCLEFSKPTLPPLADLYDLYSFNIIPKIGGIIAGDEKSYQYLVESIRKFPQQSEWADCIEKAGFSGVEWEDLTGGIVAIHTGFVSEQ